MCGTVLESLDCSMYCGEADYYWDIGEASYDYVCGGESDSMAGSGVWTLGVECVDSAGGYAGVTSGV